MTKPNITNKQIGILALILIVFLYGLKVFFWPTEKGEAKKRIATLAKIASYPAPPTILQIQSKLNSAKNAIAEDLTVDLSGFLGENTEEDKKEYTKNDLESVGQLFFQYVQRIEILTRDFKVVGKRSYQLVVMAKGKTLTDPFDDAYLVELTFNENWQLQKVKVLAPPQSEGER